MSAIKTVSVPSLPTSRFQGVLTPEDWAHFRDAIAEAQVMLEGRVIWHINSTAAGGGVAEMMRSLIGYSHGAGIDSRWLVISGNEEFFVITKNRQPPSRRRRDGGKLGKRERKIYEDVMDRNLEELLPMISAEDIVCLHDPQTAGLLPRLRETGAKLTWRSHVGTDVPNEHVNAAWEFITPYLDGADACTFTRPTYVPRHWQGRHRIVIIPPSINAFSPKNQDMSPEAARAILNHVGLPVGHDGDDPNLRSFTRTDGSLGRVDRVCDIIGERFPYGIDAPLVTQTSRWDYLKDHLGVMLGFVEHALEDTDAHLILAGPSVTSVADDPEGIEVLGRVREAWETLPDGARRRVHLVCMPAEDIDETAAIVNALQQHSTIVVQKSLQEGFGLTVSEAMWKSRPMVASAVGGIQDQITNGVNGLLIPDPYDMNACGLAIKELLDDSARADAMGVAARDKVRRNFLDNAQWINYISLFEELLKS